MLGIRLGDTILLREKEASIFYPNLRRYERVSLGLDGDILPTEELIPKNLFCILSDLHEALQPIIGPVTRELVDPKMLEAIFPKESLTLEVGGDRSIRIPEEIRGVNRLWSSTSIPGSMWSEEMPKTPTRVHGKIELVSPQGSHKSDSAGSQGCCIIENRRGW